MTPSSESLSAAFAKTIEMEPFPPGDGRPDMAAAWRGGWPLAPPPRPPKVNLSPFWKHKPRNWFELSESTFNRYGVLNSRHRYDLVLPALQDDVVDRLAGTMAEAVQLEDPYQALKDRLLELFIPDAFDQVYTLLHAPELGDRRPSDFMDWMLATLPPGEQEGLLVKGIFLSRLPDDIRSLVQTQAKTMDCRPLAAFADQLWIARNSRKSGRPVMAVAEQQAEWTEKLAALEGVVAALSVSKQGRKRQPTKKGGNNGGGQAAGGGEKREYLCRRHAGYGDRAFKCDDPKYCTWSGNEPAGQ